VSGTVTSMAAIVSVGNYTIYSGFIGVNLNNNTNEKSLLPCRRILMRPCASSSATVASFAISGGSAERARRIFTESDSRPVQAGQ
jgi:hypothetical protein